VRPRGWRDADHTEGAPQVTPPTHAPRPKSRAKDPNVHLWMAAAQGQRFAFLGQGGDAAERNDARAKALAAARKVVELSPRPDSPPRVLLRGMLDPLRDKKTPPEDNDLEAFKGDPEFEQVIFGA
jgi:hypothetical protein